MKIDMHVLQNVHVFGHDTCTCSYTGWCHFLSCMSRVLHLYEIFRWGRRKSDQSMVHSLITDFVHIHTSSFMLRWIFPHPFLFCACHYSMNMCHDTHCKLNCNINNVNICVVLISAVYICTYLRIIKTITNVLEKSCERSLKEITLIGSWIQM